MSSVDERIVRMTFDNSEFSNKIQSTINSLNQLNKSTDEIANNTNGLNAIGKAFEQTEVMAEKAGLHISNIWLKVANIFEQQVATKIVNVSKQIANAMTMEGVSDGFKEYELKMGSIQTIMAGTGESLATVNKYLEELNTYSDKTIYSFADMTNNIGKFTNAGVKLEDAVAAIKGIANEAALSGANANEASRAMYNFSQALSAGYVKLIDWKSIENANMATKGFKDTLLEVASSVGTVEKQADGMYKVLTKNANGATMKELVSGTKNFNDSLAQQWMTTEVLTKALKIYATDLSDFTQAEKDAFAEELGLTPEQLKPLEELGHKATAAASEIKTFTMLIDTLKEAIGSGWAMTFQNVIGDFEEAKELWTEIGNVMQNFIDKQSNSRNEILATWKTAGGRTDLIDGMRKAVTLLAEALAPIGKAFREVFPQKTAKDLWDLTRAFRDFVFSLKIGDETIDNIGRTAKGFFSALDIGLKFVKALINAILPAGKGVASLSGSILDATANIGDFITNLDKTITETNLFESTFEKIGNVVGPIFNLFKSGLSGMLELISGLFQKLNDVTVPMESVGDIFSSAMETIGNGIENVKSRVSKLSPILNGVVALFKTVGNVLKTVFKSIGDTISDFTKSGTGSVGLTSLINTLMSGGIVYKILTGAKSFSAFGETLENFGDVLEGFQQKIMADTLITIAKAVAILAASIFIVATIDSNRLAGATAAIGTMAVTLAGAMALLMKAVNGFSTTQFTKSFNLFGKEIFGSDVTSMVKMAATLRAVSKALIAMGAAVLMMAIGLKVVSSAAEGGHLWDSWAVVSLMLAELTAVAIVLGKWGGKGTKGAKNLKGMTESLVIMAAALAIVAKVAEGGNLAPALGAITIMLAELTAVVVVVERLGKHKLGSMNGLISMAISLNLVVIALKSVSDALGSDGNRVWQALGIISIMLAELAAVSVVMSKFAGFAALGGAGAILAVTSVLIMVQALKQISDELGKTDQHVWQALGVIAASLLILAVGLTAMGPTLVGSASLLIASTALIALGGALKIMGSMNVGEIAKSLVTLALGLGILAVNLALMTMAIPGAAALVIASAGLIVFATALKMLGSMKLGEIVKALLSLLLGLTGLAVLSTIFSVVTPLLVAFGLGIAALGAGFLACGVGLTLFSAGMQSLISLLPFGVAAIKSIVVLLLSLVPILVGTVLDTLGLIAEKIVQYAPTIGAAVTVIISTILDVIASLAVKFAETALELITTFLQLLAEYTPEIVAAGSDFVVGLIEGLEKEIPRIIDATYKLAIALINGLADAIENNNGDLMAAVDHLMDSVIQAITQWLLEITPLGSLIPDDLKEGIMSGEFRVWDAIKGILDDCVTKIKEKVKDFKEAAEDLLGGFVEGLKGTWAGKAVSAAVQLGKDVVGGLKSKEGLDENSPSKKGEEAGEYLTIGVANGIKNNEDEAVEEAEKFGGKVGEGVKDSVAEGLDGVDEEFDGVAKKAEEAAKSLDINTNAIKHNTATTFRQALIVAKQKKDMEERNKAQKEATEETEENTKATNANTEATDKNTTSKGKATKETKKQVEVTEYANGVLDEFVKHYGKLYEKLGDDAPLKVATVAIRNLAEATYKSSVVAKKATEDNKETKASIEDMIKAFTEMKTKIYDSVKSMFEGDNFFQKFELKTEKSMADILEAMKSNVDGVANWSTKLAQLGNSGLNEGLLKQLAELGPKGFEYVNAFSNATTEQIQQANTLFAQAATLPDSVSDSVLASYAQAGLNVVAGFANGIDENAALATLSMENLGLTSLQTLETALQEQSPSRATYQDGLYLVQGLHNGIMMGYPIALNVIRTLCETIIIIVESRLNASTFFGYGYNIGVGLADGINAAIPLVEAAAAALSAAADHVTTEFNMIKSPSKRYRSYGGYIAEGLALGMEDGVSNVEAAATTMSEAIKNTLSKVEEMPSDDLEIHPVISPILDLSNVRANASAIGGLLPSRSIGLASSIRIGSVEGSYRADDQSENSNSGASINFTQNNYSPKALSRQEIYRQTKKQLSMMKGVVQSYV